MNGKVTVVRLVSKTEEVEILTADGKYRLPGQLATDSMGASSFNGGDVVRQADGVEVARVESWRRDSGMTVRICPGFDLMEVSAVVKELTDAFTGTDGQPAAEEGGAA